MECKYVQDKLSDYIDLKLDKKVAIQVEEHLNSCDACKKIFNETKSMLGFLHSVKEKPLPSFYQTQLEAKLDGLAHHKQNQSAWFKFKWQIVVSVFMLGIFAGSSVLVFSPKNSKKLNPYTLTIGQVGILSFNLFSKEDVKNIVFHVRLPEGISLASKPKDRTFKWEGELVKGENVISLYVRGLKDGNWSVNAVLKSNDNTVLKEFEMPLTVTESKG